MKNPLILALIILLMYSAAIAQFPEQTDNRPADFAGEPAISWKVQVSGPVVASPVIDNGSVYISSLDSTLYAFDLETGSLKWKLPTGGPVRSSVCVTEHRLFLLSTDGILYRMEKDSGRVDGFFQTMVGYMGDKQADYADHYTSTPVVSDSVIYFGAGEYIYAISIADGFTRWTFKTDGYVHTKPVLGAGRLYAGSLDGHLYAIDLRTGNLVWKFKSTGSFGFPKGEMAGNPVFAAGKVYIGSRDNNLYAVDTRGGFANWIKQFPFGWPLPLVVNDSVIYVSTCDENTVAAYDLVTGLQRWVVSAGAGIYGGVAAGRNFGYVGTVTGKLHSIDLQKGVMGWTLELDSYKANRKQYFSDKGKFRDDIGSLIRTPLDIIKMYRQLGAVVNTPALSGNHMVVAGYDGKVYCFTAAP